MGVLGFDDGLDQLQALPLGGERGGACGAVRGLERGCDPGSGAPLDEVPDGVAGRWTLAEIGVEVGSADVRGHEKVPTRCQRANCSMGVWMAGVDFKVTSRWSSQASRWARPADGFAPRRGSIRKWVVGGKRPVHNSSDAICSGLPVNRHIRSRRIPPDPGYGIGRDVAGERLCL